MQTAPQLALPVSLEEGATCENYWPCEAQRALLAAIEQPLQEFMNYLHGASGAGKSHLLQAVCHRQSDAVYLPLAMLVDAPPEALLEALENAPLIALDDIDQVAGDAHWEEALFHFVNRARMADAVIWVAAARPAAQTNFLLADLRSRLAGGVTWGMPDYSDEDKQRILRFRAQRRGIDLPAAVAAFLCSRDSRALGDLLQTLERLDEASLQLQRPLTVPMVKQVMGW